MAVRIALSALLLAALLTLAGLRRLLLLLLVLLVLVLLAALILLITHGTLLTVGGLTKEKRGAQLPSSSMRRFGLTIVCATSLAFAAKAQDRAACRATLLGTFDIAAVIDARGLRLSDGREVLLAGIEVPSNHGAETALKQLLTAGKVTLHQTESGSDRYGRIVAHAFTPDGGGERWIQGEMLAAGQAQVASRAGKADCARALLTAEAKARQSRTGLWANSAYEIKASDDFDGLSTRPGRFTIAEGKVLSVRESGGTIYINFGRVWSRNLTVTILRRNKPAFAAAGMDPKKLEGARIRVRGWVEMRNGPRIEAARPEQIEVAAQN